MFDHRWKCPGRLPFLTETNSIDLRYLFYQLYAWCGVVWCATNSGWFITDWHYYHRDEIKLSLPGASSRWQLGRLSWARILLWRKRREEFLEFLFFALLVSFSVFQSKRWKFLLLENYRNNDGDGGPCWFTLFSPGVLSVLWSLKEYRTLPTSSAPASTLTKNTQTLFSVWYKN